MFLPAPIIAVLSAFQPAFTQPTYRKMVVLVVGTLLARGRRTVASALRQMGLHASPSWAKYHHVLNRSAWSALTVSRILLQLVVATFVELGSTVTIVVDETLERRWGRKIRQRCHWRDSRLSSRERNVTTSGLRWVVMAVVVTLPWTEQRWALPFLSVVATTPKVSLQLQRRHKTVPRLAQQMVKLLRRWLPTVPIKLVGDNAYSVIDLGTVCRTARVTLIAPLRLDARLFAPPPATKAAIGRPRVVGQRLPDLRAVLADGQTGWPTTTITWYGSTCKAVELTTGTALWYSTGFTPLPLRWVLVRDPAGKLASRAFFSTDQGQDAATIVTDFIQRWPLEVTFEESRAHLGLETQRQWSDKAIARSTPALLGLFSLTTLLGHSCYPTGNIPIASAAWYRKRQATFSDVLAAVRRTLWNDLSFQTWPMDPTMVVVPRWVLSRLTHAVCY
jgi:hypothetical protein